MFENVIFSRQKYTSGTAPPVSDTHSVGDMVINTATSVGGPVGWTCTVAGTPGTWQSFGTVGASGSDLWVNVKDYGALPDSGTTNNVASFTAAFTVANASNRPIYIPADDGEYWFTTDAGLPELTTCPGIIGEFGAPLLKWTSRDGDCVRLRGIGKRLQNLSVANLRTSDLSARSAAIRITNCAYGVFDRVTGFVGAVNNSAIMLEQAYDGSLDDAYLLAHIGAWYNTFDNVQVTYLTVGGDVGYGLDFYLNPNAISVVNPTGQTPGTYTGSISHNTVNGINIEGMERGINLVNASSNIFMGGQFSGNRHQVYGRNSSGNSFISTKHNQWGTTYATKAWTRVTTTATITSVAHGLSTGNRVYVSVTSDAAAIPLGYYTVTVTGVDTYTITCLDAGAASGTVSYVFGSVFNLDGTCQANYFIGQTFSHVLVQPWQLGIDNTIASTLGAAPTWMGGADGVSWDAPFFRGGVLRSVAGLKALDLNASSNDIYRPDAAGVAISCLSGQVQTFGRLDNFNAQGSLVALRQDVGSNNTTDATPTDVGSCSLDNNQASLITFTVTAKRTGGARGTGAVNDCASWEVKCLAVKNGTGATAATIVDGSVTTSFISADLLAAGVTVAAGVDVSGLVKISGTGAADVNLSWTTTSEIKAIA